MADGDGVGVTETVAVTVTGGGACGVRTTPAVRAGSEPPDVSRNSSSGVSATPSAAEARTTRREGSQAQPAAAHGESGSRRPS